MLPGIDGGLGAIFQVEFFQKIADVGLDGAFAQDQRLGDLGVGFARRNQAQDFELALGKPGEWIELFLAQALQVLEDAPRWLSSSASSRLP